MKKYLIIALALFLTPIFIQAALVPTSVYRDTVGAFIRPLISTDGFRLPSLTSKDCIGTDADGDFQTGTCTGGGTFSWTPTSYGVSTSTTLGFLNGFLSTASSTIDSNLIITGNSTTTSATTTNFHISNNLNFNGVSGSTWASFCTAITGGSGLCDGNDATGSGLTSYDAWTHPSAGVSATTSSMIFTNASSTFTGNLNITGNSTTTNATSTTMAGTVSSFYKSIADFFNATTSIGYQQQGVTILTASSTTPFNTAVGALAGTSLQSAGTDNTLIGYGAGAAITTGDENVGIGSLALQSLAGSSYNVAIGSRALRSNISGTKNVALGSLALELNTSDNNFGLGASSLSANVTGSDNISIGVDTLSQDTSGSFNTVIGSSNMALLDGGTDNSVVGYRALAGVEGASSDNSVLGFEAGFGTLLGSGVVNNSVLVGSRAGYALSGASNNILIGYRAGDNITTGASNLIIGYDINGITAALSNTLNIGNLIYSRGVNGTGSLLSTGNVGISTTSPYAKLSVAGETVASHFTATTTSQSTFPRFTSTLSTTTSATTTNFAISSLTSTLVQTDANGSTAEYAGTTCTNQFVRVLSALGVATCATVDVSADTNLTAGTNITLTGDDLSVDDAFLLNTGDTGTGDYSLDSPTLELVSARNNIGIGTTTPRWALQIASSTGAQLTLSDNGVLTNNHWSFRNAGGTLYIATSSPTTYATTSNNSFTLAPADSGSAGLLIGTSTPGSTGLAVNGTVFLHGLTQATGGTNNDLCISSTPNQLIEETTGVCVVSSRKFKHDIKTLNLSGIDTLTSLRSVSFSPNDNASFDFKDVQYGFIAEEVAEADPHLAKYGIDGEPRTLDDWAILSVVVKAVQEMWHKIVGIDERVSKLEAENIELRARIEALEHDR